VPTSATIDEEQAYTFTATASDPQAPPQTLTFSLDAGAPAGAAMTGAGAFTWTPTEAQGPGSFNVTIRVTDDGSPPLSDGETITITVLETNAAPVLAAITNRFVVAGDYISFTNSATDSDLPANALAYGLGVGAPAGASVQALTGQFQWLVPTNQPAGTNTITIIVTDDGTPARSHARTIDVVVAGPLRITSVVETGGSVTITAASMPGARYTLVTRDDLGPAGSWNAVGPTQTAIGTSVSFSVPVVGSVVQRFYRVLLLP